MIYLIGIFRLPLLAAFLLGAGTGWFGRAAAEIEGRRRRFPFLFSLAVLLLIAGVAVAASQLLQGRAALALDSALLFFGFYLAGSALGALAPRRRARSASEVEPARTAPVRVEPKMIGPKLTAAERQALRPLPFQAVGGRRATPIPPPMPMPSSGYPAPPVLSPFIADNIAKTRARHERAAVSKMSLSVEALGAAPPVLVQRTEKLL